MMYDGCDCEFCRARWFSDVISYARHLESQILDIREMFNEGPMTQQRWNLVWYQVQRLASVAERRDLAGEIAAEAQAWNEKMAATLREEGRLH